MYYKLGIICQKNLYYLHKMGLAILNNFQNKNTSFKGRANTKWQFKKLVNKSLRDYFSKFCRRSIAILQ